VHLQPDHLDDFFFDMAHSGQPEQAPFSLCDTRQKKISKIAQSKRNSLLMPLMTLSEIV
jgi:hypothetical protein